MTRTPTTPPKLIAIVGPTASGKTTLAIDIAQRIHSTAFEAINADSRQVYRHMDIGTAKPTAAERVALPHHLLDIVGPDESFSLARWLELANKALDAVWTSGHTPIVVGGTGQYVWALLEGWRVPQVPADETFRAERGDRSAAELLAELKTIDPESEQFIQPQNARRIIRALEVTYATGQPFSFWRTKEPPQFEWLALGPTLTREELYARIDARVDDMIGTGFVDEVRRLRETGYSADLPSMSSIGYGEILRHLAGDLTLEEAAYRTKVGTHRLARHQNAWFKAADGRIHWVTSAEAAASLVQEFLNA